MSALPPPRFVCPAFGFWEGRQTWWRPPPPPRPGAAASCGPHGPGLRWGRHGRGGPGWWGGRRDRRQGPRRLLCFGGLRAWPGPRPAGGKAGPRRPAGAHRARTLGFSAGTAGPGQGRRDCLEGTEPAILSGRDFCFGDFAAGTHASAGAEKKPRVSSVMSCLGTDRC